MGIIARIVFHLPMTPYVLCLRQASGAWGRHSYYSHFLAGLAQSVERLSAKRKRAFDSRGQSNTQGLKKTLRNEGTPFTVQAARPSRGSDDHVKWRSRLP